LCREQGFQAAFDCLWITSRVTAQGGGLGTCITRVGNIGALLIAISLGSLALALSDGAQGEQRVHIVGVVAQSLFVIAACRVKRVALQMGVTALNVGIRLGAGAD
jgi:hypothetical protein